MSFVTNRWWKNWVEGCSFLIYINFQTLSLLFPNGPLRMIAGLTCKNNQPSWALFVRFALTLLGKGGLWNSQGLSACSSNSIQIIYIYGLFNEWVVGFAHRGRKGAYRFQGGQAPSSLSWMYGVVEWSQRGNTAEDSWPLYRQAWTGHEGVERGRDFLLLTFWWEETSSLLRKSRR